VRHNQDKGSPISRALQALEAGAASRLVAQSSLLEGRIGENRNHEREVRANAAYEELRLFTKDELYTRAGLTSPRGHPRGSYSSFSRQELIAMIIQREVT
jgi:hypothetical protein